MTPQKHTPGPWVANVVDCALALIPDANGNLYWEICPETFQYHALYLCVSGWMSEANARLLAAAPQLLETLHEAEEYFDDRADADHDGERHLPNKEMRLLSLIRDAIAKAEGK
jgi:hypothetical protein